jgi:hypothetical protein
MIAKLDKPKESNGSNILQDQKKSRYILHLSWFPTDWITGHRPSGMFGHVCRRRSLLSQESFVVMNTRRHEKFEAILEMITWYDDSNGLLNDFETRFNLGGACL